MFGLWWRNVHWDKASKFLYTPSSLIHHHCNKNKKNNHRNKIHRYHLLLFVVGCCRTLTLLFLLLLLMFSKRFTFSFPIAHQQHQHRLQQQRIHFFFKTIKTTTATFIYRTPVHHSKLKNELQRKQQHHHLTFHCMNQGKDKTSRMVHESNDEGECVTDRNHSSVYQQQQQHQNNNNNNNNMNNGRTTTTIPPNHNNNKKTKIAIIGGGGAAGLTSARAFQKYYSYNNNNNNYDPIELTVFEKSHTIGGVWDYQYYDDRDNSRDNEKTNKIHQKKQHPMYRHLRTNLPKELMAYQDVEWDNCSIQNDINDNDVNDNVEKQQQEHDHSFVSHKNVKQYLQFYAKKFGLESNIKFNCTVHQMTILLPPTAEKEPTMMTTEEGSIGSVLHDSMVSKQPLSSNEIQLDDSLYSTISLLNDDKNEQLPKIKIEWTQTVQKTAESQHDTNIEEEKVQQYCYDSDIFDGVIICNGHYNRPTQSLFTIPGLNEYFKGTVIHSIEYNQPEDYIGQTVLCIGARASGSDIAREIASVDTGTSSSKIITHVYLSDSTYTGTEPDTQYNVTLVPRTKCILPNGTVLFESKNSTTISRHIDTILLCTGYEYDYPFLNRNSCMELSTLQRCVKPLYEQLWHATYPNVAFIGLPHSVVPFPLFEIQAQAVVHQWFKKSCQDINHGKTICSSDIATRSTNSTNGNEVEVMETIGSSSSDEEVLFLPNRVERERCAMLDSISGGPEPNGRIPQDTHYLGSHQWDYCRKIAKYANLYTNEYEIYLQTNKEIWDYSGMERKNVFPAGPDHYRETVFERTHHPQTFKVVSSIATSNIY